MDKGHLSGDLLCDLAEGQLAPAERREAEAHVEGCADCRRELEALQGYFQDMSSLETLKAPDRFLTKVHVRIAKASPWKRLLAILSSPRLMPVPVAAFCLMMVGAFLFYHVRKSNQDSATVVALSAPAQKSETSGEGERVATLPATPYSMPRARKNVQASRSADAPITLSSRLERSSGTEAETPASATRLSKARPRTISGRGGRAALESDGLAATGKGADSLVKLAGKDSPADEGYPSSSANMHAYASEETDSETESLPAAPASVASPTVASAPVAASAPASAKAKKASSQAVAKASGRVADREMILSNNDSEPVGDKREALSSGEAIVPAPPSVTPKPWAPTAYTLKMAAGRSEPAPLRPGLASLGIRVLRHEVGAAERYELEVPAARVAKLEEYLRGYGALVSAPKPIPGGKDGAPIRMTLWVTRSP